MKPGVALPVCPRLARPGCQRILALIAVCVALLLDNMLYMALVPIVPTYLAQLEKASETVEEQKTGVHREAERRDAVATLSIIVPTSVIQVDLKSPGKEWEREKREAEIIKSKEISEVMKETPGNASDESIEAGMEMQGTRSASNISVKFAVNGDNTDYWERQKNETDGDTAERIKHGVNGHWESDGNWTEIRARPSVGSNNLEDVQGKDKHHTSKYHQFHHHMPPTPVSPYSRESTRIGVLFASKACVQLVANSITGTITAHLGYETPLLLGLGVLFGSTAGFAAARSYWGLLVARSAQGVGSALANTAGIALLAAWFRSEPSRSRAMGLSLACISLGSLAAPPFAGALAQFAGHQVPFVILAAFCLSDALLLFLFIAPAQNAEESDNISDNDENSSLYVKEKKEPKMSRPSVPLSQLLSDPIVALAATALTISNIPLAFLEPTLASWMETKMAAVEWQAGVVWLPSFFPHVGGVIITVRLSSWRPNLRWLWAALGLVTIGLSSAAVPACKSPTSLAIPLASLCLGMAFVDTALLPTLAAAVDLRHGGAYGSVFALADLAYCVAYAAGPLVASRLASALGFSGLALSMGVINLLLSPMLLTLRGRELDVGRSESRQLLLLANGDGDDGFGSLEMGVRAAEGIKDTNREFDNSNFKETSEVGGQRSKTYDVGIANLEKRVRAGNKVVNGELKSCAMVGREMKVEKPAGKLIFERKDDLETKEKNIYMHARHRKSKENHRQEFLPKLPLPELSSTLECLLESAQLLEDRETFQEFKDLVREFGQPGAVGQMLQEDLRIKREETENWVNDWWISDMYLMNRAPLPVNSNPGMILPCQHFSSLNQGIRFASRIVAAILDYKYLIDTNCLPVERGRGAQQAGNLCQKQNGRLFGSTRIPGSPCDTLLPPVCRWDGESVVVVCGGQFFLLVIPQAPLSVCAMEQALGEVVRKAGGWGRRKQCHVAKEAVGLFTSLGRSEWSRVRRRLLKDSNNQASLQAIEQSAFILCLDEPNEERENEWRKNNKEERETELMAQMLHGGGSQKNGKNRWFDKTLQVVLGADGVLGLNYEHSAAEGIVVTQCLNHVLLSLLADSLSICVRSFEEFGTRSVKLWAFSPDAFIQVALQLAYYRMHGDLTHTYESASTRSFQNGRADNIRSATKQAKCLAQAAWGTQKETEKLQLLREAVRVQTENTRKVVKGHGSDCHLLALREQAKKRQVQTPELFLHPAYVNAQHFLLSTSQIPSPWGMMGYGPVELLGFGASYNPQPDDITFCISSWREQGSFESCAVQKDEKLKGREHYGKQGVMMRQRNLLDGTVRAREKHGNVIGHEGETVIIEKAKVFAQAISEALSVMGQICRHSEMNGE
uniref:Choline O-acetyltransferase n=1 Tax=Eptatretus burgeri TaxID=7764 RepID=A0A8C4WZR7_EPTBU